MASSFFSFFSFFSFQFSSFSVTGLVFHFLFSFSLFQLKTEKLKLQNSP